MRILVAAPDESPFDEMRGLSAALNVSLDYVSSAEDTLELVNGHDYGVLLLNFDVPNLAGLALLRSVRQWTADLPILVVASPAPTAFKISALTQGADDYIVRPCEPAELAARIQAVCRRTQRRATREMGHGRLRLDPVSRTASCNGRVMGLTAREYDLLDLLMVQRGDVVSKQALLRHLYDEQTPSDGNVLRVFIHNLRRKLELAGCTDTVSTYRGQGYMLSRNEATVVGSSVPWHMPGGAASPVLSHAIVSGL